MFRALDVLAKASKASDGVLLDAAAAEAEASTTICRPWSRSDFQARLRVRRANRLSSHTFLTQAGRQAVR